MIAHLLSTTGTWSAMWGVGMCCFNSLNYYHVAKSVFRLGGFFQQIGDFLEQGQIIFGNMVTIAVKKFNKFVEI